MQIRITKLTENHKSKTYIFDQNIKSTVDSVLEFIGQKELISNGDLESITKGKNGWIVNCYQQNSNEMFVLMITL